MPTILIKNQSITWEVDDHGFFHAHIPVEGAEPISLRSDSLADLKTQLEKVLTTSRPALSIPAVILRSNGKGFINTFTPVRVTVRGKHSSTGAILITLPDSRKDSYRGKFYVDMSDPELDEWTRLLRAEEALQIRLRDFSKSHEVNISAEIEKLGGGS